MQQLVLAAIRFLRDALPAVESALSGLRNEDLLATYQLLAPAGGHAPPPSPLAGLTFQFRLVR